MSDRDDADNRPGWHPDTLGSARLAGDAAAQLAWRRLAEAALETYRTPAKANGNRIANAWLGERGWRVQPVGHHLLWKEDWVAPLTAAADRAGLHTMLGGFFGACRDTAPIWIIDANPDGISRFFEAHQFDFHMLFPSNFTFLVHANEGDFGVYAGPEDFLRSAIPPDDLGPNATERVRASLEFEHGPGWFDGILEHYAPFLLED